MTRTDSIMAELRILSELCGRYNLELLALQANYPMSKDVEVLTRKLATMQRWITRYKEQQTKQQLRLVK